MWLAVLSAPRQAPVRGRGGSRFAARGHRGSRVLRRAPCVTGLAAEALKTGCFVQKCESNPRDFSILQPPSHSFVASLKARCALSEEFEAQPGSIAWHLQSPSQHGHPTPYTAHRITRRLNMLQKPRSMLPFVRPKAACSADLAITSYLLWQLVCSQWLCTRSALANAKRQPCCRTRGYALTSQLHPRAETHSTIRGERHAPFQVCWRSSYP